MQKSMKAWKAWNKRVSAPEAARCLAETKEIDELFVCNGNLCFLINASEDWQIGMRVPFGRDGLIGGLELMSVMLPDGRKVAEIPELVEVYGKIMRAGEKAGFLVAVPQSFGGEFPPGC